MTVVVVGFLVRYSHSLGMESPCGENSGRPPTAGDSRGPALSRVRTWNSRHRNGGLLALEGGWLLTVDPWSSAY